MCIRNVLDGFMAWYWRNLANGIFTPEVTGQSPLAGDQAGWPGVKPISTPFGAFGKNVLNCMNTIGKNFHRSKRACHKYLLPRVWRKVCLVTQTSSRSLAWSLRHESQVRFVQSTDPGPGQIVDTLPPVDRGWGLLVFVTKINKWSARGRETDRTVEEWIKHSSSGWQHGGYLIFVVIYSHSSLSGWLYLPDPESPVRSQAGNTFLRLLLTEICLTSIWTHSKVE